MIQFVRWGIVYDKYSNLFNCSLTAFYAQFSTPCIDIDDTTCPINNLLGRELCMTNIKLCLIFHHVYMHGFLFRFQRWECPHEGGGVAKGGFGLPGEGMALDATYYSNRYQLERSVNISYCDNVPILLVGYNNLIQ